MRLVMIIAPPGGGKGTQAELMTKKYGFVHVETSKLIIDKLRMMDDADPKLVDAKEAWESGRLIDSELVSNWIMARVRQLASERKDIVLSGSPRTVYEAKLLESFFEELYGRENVVAIHIVISEEESVRRNSHRRICLINRHPVPFTEDTKDLTACPMDGSPLVSRGKLDTPEVIRQRYKIYKSETEPVLDLFRLHKHIICEVNGEHSISDIFKQITKCLDAHTTKKQKRTGHHAKKRGPTGFSSTEFGG